MNAPGRRSHPLARFSIDQVMIVILIMALCLAPLVAAIRTREGDKVLSAIVFDIVVIPVCGVVAVATLMKPGPKRTWYVKAFLVTPLLFLMAMLMLSVPLIIFGLAVLQ